jgi:FkbM family methyltransferase
MEIIKVEYRGKEFQFYDTPTAKTLVQEIFSDCYKIFEREIDIPAGSVVLDIGACEGMFSIMVAKLFPDIKIIAVEPVPRTFYQMLRNIGINGVTNVETVQAAVGPTMGKMTLNVSRDYSGGSSSVIKFVESDMIRVEAEMITLDELFRGYKLDKDRRVRLMKIDIEGSEYEVLANTSMLKYIDYVVAEFHANKNLIDTGKDMRELACLVGSQTRLTFYQPCFMAE